MRKRSPYDKNRASAAPTEEADYATSLLEIARNPHLRCAQFLLAVLPPQRFERHVLDYRQFPHSPKNFPQA
jgi:hypothetical protein